MKTTPLLAIAFGILASACSSTIMIESTYNASTGGYSRKVYTKYYDAGDWVLPNHLGASVAGDHMKRRVPVLYGIQQSMGALGPGDSEAQAKMTVYLWNFDNTPHAITDIRLTANHQTLRVNGQAISAAPKTRTGVEVGVIDIFDSGTEIPVKMHYTVNGKQYTQSLTLIRRTEDQLKALYGPQGKLPYPWHARRGELK